MSDSKRTPTQKQLNDCAKEVARLARKYTDKEVIDVIAMVAAIFWDSERVADLRRIIPEPVRVKRE